MKVLSVNVSKVLTIEHRGRDVTTGIFKQAVSGPISVGSLNLAGDEQADLVNHGGEHKAVYAFGHQHYRHWSAVLERQDLTAGFFGENLTIDSLDESSLFIGDTVQVGSVSLQVTQPRVPCFKLGIKTGWQPMPRQFVQHGLTGVYFRVLKAGVLEAGDTASVKHAGTSACSLATLFAAVHDSASPDRREVMREALDNPALSSEWRTLIEHRLQRLP